MNSKIILLQKIRDMSEEALGQFLCGPKSIGSLNQFFNGYNFGRRVEAWEKSTDRDFFENFDEAMQSQYEPFGSYNSALDYLNFAEFVHSYYNRHISAANGLWLIIEMHNSEEEVFDKYLELRIAFLKQEESGHN